MAEGGLGLNGQGDSTSLNPYGGERGFNKLEPLRWGEGIRQDRTPTGGDSGNPSAGSFGRGESFLE